MTNETTTPTIAIPSIISANTYFWNAAGNASCRRRNEEKRLAEVENFFQAIGFETENTGSRVIAKRDTIVAEFSYSESCKNVYKHFNVTKNGKNSNITAVKKYLN